MEKGTPLSELKTWDLDDIEKANAFLDMKSDYETAQAGYQRRQAEQD